VDIKALLKWAKSQGIFGNLYIGSVQYGVEITSTNNTGTNFGFNNGFTWN
jgi:zinc protease